MNSADVSMSKNAIPGLQTILPANWRYNQTALKVKTKSHSKITRP